jgi:hypothetical protein
MNWPVDIVDEDVELLVNLGWQSNTVNYFEQKQNYVESTSCFLFHAASWPIERRGVSFFSLLFGLSLVWLNVLNKRCSALVHPSRSTAVAQFSRTIQHQLLSPLLQNTKGNTVHLPLVGQ